jgi:hypothetical protein
LKCSINFASEKQNQFVKTDYDRWQQINRKRANLIFAAAAE